MHHVGTMYNAPGRGGGGGTYTLPDACRYNVHGNHKLNKLHYFLFLISAFWSNRELLGWHCARLLEPMDSRRVSSAEVSRGLCSCLELSQRVVTKFKAAL